MMAAAAEMKTGKTMSPVRTKTMAMMLATTKMTKTAMMMKMTSNDSEDN